MVKTSLFMQKTLRLVSLLVSWKPDIERYKNTVGDNMGFLCTPHELIKPVSPLWLVLLLDPIAGLK